MPGDEEEAQFVVDEILEMTATEKRSYEDIAILFRMNSLSRMFESKLREYKIPYKVIGGQSFFDRREIKDLLAYLSVIKNQDDEFNYRLIQNGGKIWFDPSIKSKYFSRQTLIKLFKQYFYYGFYKVRVFQKRRGVAAIRQLIPFIFVTSLFASMMLKILTNNSIFLILIFGIYTIINFIFSYISIRNRKENYLSIPILQCSYFILHFSYGFGFILGLIYFIFKWNRTGTLDNNFDKNYFAENNS